MSVGVVTGMTPRLTTGIRPAFAGQISLLLTFVLLVTLLFRDCFSEMVFHRRRQTDQDYYSNQPRHSYSVQTYEDATNYLSKYGYLNCHSASLKPNSEKDQSSSSSRHHHQHHHNHRNTELDPNDHHHNHHHQHPPIVRPLCTEYDIKEALKALQESFDLSPTGRLDDDTKQTMNKGRCGNSDNQQQQQQQQQVVAVAGGSSDKDQNGTDPSRPNRTGKHKKPGIGRKRLKNGIKNGRVTRASARHIEHTITEDDSKGSRWGQRSGDIPHRRTPRSIIDPEEGLTGGDPLRRRLEMLREIATRMKSTPPRNSTRAEQRLARWMTSRGSRARVRRKRSSVLAEFVSQVFEGGTDQGSRVRLVKDVSKPVRWRLLASAVSGKIPLSEQKASLELSFRMWSEVIPLKFSEDENLELAAVDIVISFGRETHGSCEKPFDGNGGELAHSWSAGDIHFDEDENFKKDGSGIDLLKVAVHEVGHVLGLLHNNRDSSIMYPIYVSPQTQDEFELVREDREAVQQIYGVCKGSFDIVFDWVRRVNDPSTYGTPKYVFNTYFFRNARYWMYENSFNRTRYGDPLYIEQQWSGLPSHIDAFTQVIVGSGYDFNIDTYFFKGELYYKYSSQTDSVIDGYPRFIAQDFGAAQNSSHSVPDHIDAVYFNSTDNMLYFYKGEWVWIYDPTLIGQNSCCVDRRQFVELYPTLTDPEDQELLTGHISSIYYSYSLHTTYIFQGETVYELVTKDSTVSVKKLTQWYNIWYDICEVD